MKNATTLFLLLIISAASFSQQPQSVKTDYLQKSKNKKKTALILLGGGAALFITGLVIPKGESTDLYNPWSGEKDVYENDDVKAGFEMAGTLSMLASIPFFIASGKNKKRAAAVSFKNEKMPQLQKNYFVYKPIPSLSLKISL